MATPYRKRIVVTGVGVVSPVGIGIGSFWDKIIAGECGINQISAFDTEGYSCTIAGEVKNFDATGAFPSPNEIRRTDLFAQFGIHAAWQALIDSELNLDKANRDRVGAFIGSGIGGLATMEDQHNTLLNRGPGRISPFFIPMMILNMSSGMFSLYHGLRGPNAVSYTHLTLPTKA